MKNIILYITGLIWIFSLYFLPHIILTNEPDYGIEVGLAYKLYPLFYIVVAGLYVRNPNKYMYWATCAVLILPFLGTFGYAITIRTIDNVWLMLIYGTLYFVFSYGFWRYLGITDNTYFSYYKTLKHLPKTLKHLPYKSGFIKILKFLGKLIFATIKQWSLYALVLCIIYWHTNISTTPFEKPFLYVENETVQSILFIFSVFGTAGFFIIFIRGVVLSLGYDPGPPFDRKKTELIEEDEENEEYEEEV